jgi:hypothetical protein
MHLLTELANKYPLDKGTNFAEAHGYTEIYGPLFEPLKNLEISLLEIGVWHGHSLRLWEDYFPHAEITAIDNDRTCLKEGSNRSKVYIGHQADLRFMENIGNREGDFDIIIDDGSHLQHDVITSFSVLYRFLKKGGLYFVEDLHVMPYLQMVLRDTPIVYLECSDKLAWIRRL